MTPGTTANNPIGNPGFGLTRNDPQNIYNGKTPNGTYLVPEAVRQYDAVEFRLDGRFHDLVLARARREEEGARLAQARQHRLFAADDARELLRLQDQLLPLAVLRLGGEVGERLVGTAQALGQGLQQRLGDLGAAGQPRAQGGVAEASVVATKIRTSAMHAAFANAMAAHADETDDFEPVTKAHPGCVVLRVDEK